MWFFVISVVIVGFIFCLEVKVGVIVLWCWVGVVRCLVRFSVVVLWRFRVGVVFYF